MAHVPVLAAEVSQLLELRPGHTVIDCTFGAGGHAALLEPQLGPDGTYVAIDRDPDAKHYFDAFAAKATARTRPAAWCCRPGGPCPAGCSPPANR